MLTTPRYRGRLRLSLLRLIFGIKATILEFFATVDVEQQFQIECWFQQKDVETRDKESQFVNFAHRGRDERERIEESIC